MLLKNPMTMKKLAITMAAVLFTAMNTWAADLPKVSFSTIPTEPKFSMTINGLKEDASIALRDTEGIILLEEQTEGKGNYSKVYNLSNLPEGTYYMSIKTSLKKTVQPIKLTAYGVEIDTGRRKEFYAPIIRAQEGQVDVSLYNGTAADVQITIFGNGQEVIYEEKLENVVLVEKRYSTERLPRGQYNFVINTPENIYNETFRVR